jgi:hypothetical protein
MGHGMAKAREGFVKFPRTTHLVWLGEGSPRGDKLMSAAEAGKWLRRPMSVEKNVGGANLGLSLGDHRQRAQSRRAPERGPKAEPHRARTPR